MSFQNFDAIQANRAYVSDVENLSVINGASFVNPGPRASCRLQVNPQSNPDPSIGGLIVPTKTITYLPLVTTYEGLSISKPYNNDAGGCWTIYDDYIKINKKGQYMFTLNGPYFIHNGPQCLVNFQVIARDKNMFTDADPIIAGASLSTTTTYLPFPIGYAGFGTCSCSSMATLEANTELKLGFVAFPPPDSPDDTVTISLTSGISIMAYTVE